MTVARAASGPARLFRPPGLIDFYLVRRLVGPFLAALVLAAMAMMLERALRLAQEMAASGAHLGYFLPLLGQLVPYYLGMALPAALMIALVFLIARLDESLELEAMLAAGLSLTRIALPLVGFALVVAAAAVVANGYLEPQGRHGYRLMRAEALQSARIRDLQPTIFYEPAPGLTLTFDRKSAEPGRVENVFVRRAAPGGGEALLTARGAALAIAPDGRSIRLRLEQGVSYQDADPALGRSAYSLAFRDYQMIEPFSPAWAGRPRGADQKELTNSELAAEMSGGARGIARSALAAELYSRLARSLSVALLPLLAIAVAFAPKKARRGLPVALGAALLIAFHHAVNTVKSLSLDGSPDPAIAFAALGGGFALLLFWLFAASRHLPSHGPLFTHAGTLGRRRARRPSSWLPRLAGATIGGYAARGFALWTLVSLATMILLLQMVDLIERADDFVERGFGVVEVGRYALLRLPLLAQQGLAIAALAGAMVALLRLARFSELVAMRAAGISLSRLFLMLLPVALLLSAAGILLAERAVPRSQTELASWWRATAPPAKPPEGRWFRIGGDIVFVEAVSGQSRLRGLTVYRRDAQGALAERLSAAAAEPVEGGWRLRGVRAERIEGGRLVRAREAGRLWRTALRPDDARALLAGAAFISSGDARRALAGAAPLREGPPRFETRVERAVAEPFVPVVMLLLALPLAFASSRSGPSWPLLLYPILAGMAFLVADGVLGVAAQAGLVAPWIGVWTAPAAFALIGASVLVYAEA